MSERPVERRIVTVLFADLVSFTSLSERLDAEDVVLVQDAYFDAVRETVKRHGGLLEKFVGDAVMAVFGAPRARDDDAERAVRAGLALVAAVERLDASLGLDPGTLRLRVGINSGETVYGQASAERGPVTGDAVNIAARLQTAAEPGSVVIGELTALTVADAVALEPLAPLELKGKSERLPAWRVTELFAERSRERALGGLRAPTLGRDAELAELTATVGTTTRVVLVAPPGVGKTRVLEELAVASARAGATVLRARLRPDLLSPFEPVAQLLQSGGGEAELAARLRASGIDDGRAGVVARTLAAVAAPDPGAPPVEREQLFAAWLEGLDALTGGAPAVWLVEDVHWASSDLLAFLDLAGRAPHAYGRAIVATARPVLLEDDAAWVAVATRLDLQPLAAVDTALLVRELVGEALPFELVEQIADRSGGNALFVEELLRMWGSAGILVPDGEGWKLGAAAEDVPLPPTVQAIYAGQLDDLPPSGRMLARRASVAGRRFPLSAFEPLEIEGGDAAVETLARRALVSGPLADPLLGDSYAYRHALLRDAGYASLTRAERARLHVRLADWLTARRHEDLPLLAEVIARHYAAALDNAPTLVRDLAGRSRDAVEELAAEWFEHAAAVARGFAAWNSARLLAARAVELTRPEHVLLRARRQQAQAEATANAAGVDEAVGLLREAMAGYRAARESDPAASRDGLADAGWSLGQLLRAQTLFSTAEDLAGELLAELGGPDDVAAGKLLALRAVSALNARDDYETARLDAARALAAARATGDAGLELEAAQLVAQIEAEEGGRSDELWEELAGLAQARGRWDVVAVALRNRSSFRWDDEPDEGLRLADESAEIARVHGLVESAGWADYARCEANLSAGRWDDALETGLRAIELAGARSMHRVAVRSWFVLRPLALARGRHDLLERAFPLFEARQGVEPDSPYARIVTTAMHLAFAELGLEPSFVPDLEDRLPAFDLDHGSPSWLAGIETVVGAWLRAGMRDGAEEALDRMRARLGRGPATRLARATEAILRSRLLLARGEREAAATEAAAALGTTSPWWRAKALRALEAAEAASAAQLAEAGLLERSLGL